MRAIEIPAGRLVSGAVNAPASKSVTHRLLLLAMLGGRAIVVERPLIAADTERLIVALRACGCSVKAAGTLGDPMAGDLKAGDPLPSDLLEDSALKSDPGALIVASGAAPPGRVDIDCGASGTLLRLLIGVLAGRPGDWILDGTTRLRQRPVGALVEALRGLGAEVRYLGAEGYAPLRIRGRELDQGRIRLDAGLSSQFLSALILAALSADGPVEIEVTRLTSSPYVELTLEAVRRFGGRVAVDESLYRVEPGLVPPARASVEGDYSSSAYFAAAAALAGGEVRLLGLRTPSPQGDRRFIDLLRRMGARVEEAAASLRVARGASLMALDVDMGDLPDQVPTLAALAPFARGVTRIRGAAHLRLKESDRLSAMVEELRRAGAVAEETADGLLIEGVWAEAEPPRATTMIDTHDDHRIAMSMAVVGLRRPGLRIANPEVVGKSYPRFWDDFLGVLDG